MLAISILQIYIHYLVYYLDLQPQLYLNYSSEYSS